MRPIFRLSLILLALFLAIAPAMTLAQTTTGQSTTTTTTGPATTGGSTTMTAPDRSSATTTNKTTTTDGTTTTTSTSTVPWLWIAVGAIVLIAIVGLVAANGRNETRIIS